MADPIHTKGPTAKLDAAGAALPQTGDILSKLHSYLVGRGVPSKRAARILAGALDDLLQDEATPEADDAEELIEQLESAGIQGKTPEAIANALAEALDRRAPGPDELERSLRQRVDARLAEEE